MPRVVARVNGQPISRAQFTQAYTAQLRQAEAQNQGQKVDRQKLTKQTVQTLVATELLLQRADQEHIEVSGADVRSTLQGLASQNGMKSSAQLLAAFKQQGMTRAQVLAQVRQEVRIQRVIARTAGDTTPTRAEEKKLYDQLVAQQHGGANQQKVPSFHKVQPQLKQQLAAQKKQAAARRLVNRLRRGAKISLNL